MTRGVSPTQRIWALDAVLVIAATAVALAYAGALPAPDTSVLVPWWALALAFAGAEACAVHVRVRRSSHTFTLGEIPLVLGLAFARPADLLIGITLGSLLVLLRNREQTPAKIVFNVGQLALGAVLALVVTHALIPAGAATSPSAWLALLAGAIASALVGSLLVSVAILLTSSAVPLAKLAPVFGLSLAVCIINSALALCAVGAIATEPAAGLLLLAPAGAMVMAYRQSMAERRKHERLELMHDVTALLARRDDLSAGLEGLLERTLDAFHGDYASVVLVPTEEQGAPQVLGLEVGGKPTPLGPADLELARAMHAAAGEEGDAVLLERPVADPHLDAELDRVGARWAMLATLRGEKRTLGTFLLAGQGFAREDLRLFATLAHHASTWLEQDRLEHLVSRLRELQARLEHQAHHDPLTGLANRRLFLERLEEEVQGAERHAVLFLDLDDFKTVNDSLGHGVGDELLLAVAHRLRSGLPRTDLAARLGGDEFAVLLRDVETVADCMAVGERLLGQLSAPFAIAGHELTMRASVGVVAGWAPLANSADELLARADVAMYEAKARGKQGVAVYEPHMHNAVVRRHQLKEDLQHAAERGELRVQYQPIVALDTGQIVAVEALARWEHPERGLVMPTDFIPLAEETGCVVELDRAILREACSQGRHWGDVSVHVNLSAQDLSRADLVADVASALATSGLPARRLVLEITEAALMRDASVLSVLGDLRALGLRLAIDDFGTGYSSLEYLRWAPVDILKVAKTFVDEVSHGPRPLALMRTIHDLAATMDMAVVAEGVEGAVQVEALRTLGCPLGQGFLFSEPVSAADMDCLVRGAGELVAA